MKKLSQRDRMGRAVKDLRAVFPGKEFSGSAAKYRYWRKLRESKWTRRTFETWRAVLPPPRWGLNEINTLHEMSYYLLPRAKWARLRKDGESWDRRETAWTFLKLVQHKLGMKAAKVLRMAYAKHGVKYRARRVMTAAQKAALAARFTKTIKQPKPAAIVTPTVTPARRRRYVFDD
jgi:hypothetical protein